MLSPGTADRDRICRICTRQKIDAYFRDRVFAACEVWVAVEEEAIVGFCAFRDE